ncbi:MAG TPA: hypothetical protein VFQ65_31920 [Kofleriaceae bacterium]|nr:hypothetical protein [Kofleriaceae bacterium]
MSVTAIMMSSHATYAGTAREMQAQRASSAEILKVHASVHAMMEAALDQPTVPGFVLVSNHARDNALIIASIAD